MFLEGKTRRGYGQHTKATFSNWTGIFVTEKEGVKLDNGILADVAPSLLSDMGLEVPAEMTGKNLIK